jgi:vesicle transport protein SEC22
MVQLTMIARTSDGLPLTASLQDENLTDYQTRAKQIFRKLNHSSAPKLAIEHNNMIFYYQIDKVSVQRFFVTNFN